MSTKKTVINYNVLMENGAILTLVPYPDFPNVSMPDISVPDTTQQYDISTKYEYNGKTYMYAKTAGTVGGNMGVKVKNEQDTQNRAVQAAATSGDTEITITTVSPDGPSFDGTFTKDFLKGGTVVVFPAAGATYDFTRGIIGNDVLAAAGTLKLYLDAPIPCDLTTSATAEVQASPWALVVLGTGTHLDQGRSSCCGVPPCRATTGQWIWVQTWGPTWISPSATAGDSSNNNRGVWLQGDGSITKQTATDASIGQYAGWVVSNGYGNGQAAPIVYLMIAK